MDGDTSVDTRVRKPIKGSHVLQGCQERTCINEDFYVCMAQAVKDDVESRQA
jgi:hypothetical protein